MTLWGFLAFGTFGAGLLKKKTPNVLGSWCWKSITSIRQLPVVSFSKEDTVSLTGRPTYPSINSDNQSAFSSVFASALGAFDFHPQAGVQFLNVMIWLEKYYSAAFIYFAPPPWMFLSIQRDFRALWHKECNTTPSPRTMPCPPFPQKDQQRPISG